MAHDYRYNAFDDVAEPLAISGEIHIIPSSSPYTIRLAEVPQKTTPSGISLTIAGTAASEVAATPAAGEFWVDYSTGADNDDNWNTGLIQFNAADAGKTVVVNYNGMGTLASVDFHGSQLFTASGTFTVPKGVTTVYVTGCGGGGGGAGALSAYWGGGGGAGACAMKTPLAVVAGQSYVITVGAGGAGGFITGSAGSYVHNAGGAGGTSSFGSLLSLSGGGGGNSSGSGTNGSAGGVGAMGGTPNREVAIGSESAALVDIGSGGGNMFSAGACVEDNTLRFTGANGSLYGGGGSPALDYGSNTKRNGGAGAPGFILVEW